MVSGAATFISKQGAERFANAWLFCNKGHVSIMPKMSRGEIQGYTAVIVQDKVRTIATDADVARYLGD